MRNEQNRVCSYADTIEFQGPQKPWDHFHFVRYVSSPEASRHPLLILDFSQCTKAYPNCMVPLIVSVRAARSRGLKFRCELPRQKSLMNMFIRANWAHYLDPERFAPSEERYDKHLAVTRFTSLKEQQSAVNTVLDVVMRSLRLDRSLISALEWSINELTDNVLNHAESADGGFVQLTTHRERDWLAFCVADSGRGMLESMREAYPRLRYHEDAIADAVRAGFTRNKDFGQGNGLAGCLRIATEASGHLAITSGDNCTTWRGTSPRAYTQKGIMFTGTVVDLQFSLANKLDLGEVLRLGSKTVDGTPVDVIENRYLSDDASSIIVRMSKETAGFGSRQAGIQMRTKVLNLIDAEPTCDVVLDWDGVPLVSSSYADEFLGKLFVTFGPMRFMARVRNVKMLDVVRQIVDSAIVQRSSQNGHSS